MITIINFLARVVGAVLRPLLGPEGTHESPVCVHCGARIRATDVICPECKLPQF